MTFDEYTKALVQELELSTVGQLDPTKGIFDDLGFDSLEAFELVLATEQLAGLTAPDATIPPIYTLDDAYRYYLVCQNLAISRHK